MNKKNIFKSYFNLWHKGYRFSTFIIAPVLSLIALLIVSPMIHKSYTGRKYCGGDIDKYENILSEKVIDRKVSSVYNREDITRIFCENNFVTHYIFTCSNFSINDKLKSSNIKVGDTIYKELGENQFTVKKNGQEYVFIIDSYRDINGKFIEE